MVEVAEKVKITSFDLDNYIKFPTSSGQVFKKAEQGHTFDAPKKFVTFQPQTTVASNLLTSGGEVRFRIPNNSVGRILSGYLEFQVSESGGANTVTPAPVQYFVSRIEYTSENGGRLLQTQFGDNLFWNLANVSNEHLTNLVPLMNMNTSFAGTSAITASQTRVYQLPLIGAWWESVQPVMPLLNDINIKVICVNSVESGTGTLSCSGVTLVIEHEELQKEDIVKFKKLYYDEGVEYNIVDNVYQSNTQSFPNSSAIIFPLSASRGKCGSIWFCLRATSGSNTSGANRTYTQLSSTTNAEASIELLDSANVNMNGGSVLKSNWLRYFHSSQYFPSQMFASIPIYVISFGNPASHAHGNHVGSVKLTTYEKLRINTAAAGGFTSGTYTLDVYTKMFRHIHIKDGMISVSSE